MRIFFERGPKADAIRKSDGAFFQGSSPDSFEGAMSPLFDLRANMYYFKRVIPKKTWYGVRWEYDGEIWEFRDHALFDVPGHTEFVQRIVEYTEQVQLQRESEMMITPQEADRLKERLLKALLGRAEEWECNRFVADVISVDAVEEVIKAFDFHEANRGIDCGNPAQH